MKKLLLAGIMSIVFLGVGAMSSSAQVRIKPRVEIVIGNQRHDHDRDNRDRDYNRRYPRYPRGIYNGYESIRYETVYVRYGWRTYREVYRVSYFNGYVRNRVLISREVVR